MVFTDTPVSLEMESKDPQDSPTQPKKKPCRVCTDFRSMAFSSSSKTSNNNLSSHPNPSSTTNASIPPPADPSLHSIPSMRCPPDSIELGRASWTLLHTMAAYYPEKPSETEKTQMTQFIQGLARFYPCEYCASHLQKDLPEHPPQLNSNVELSQWFCSLHNRVNQRLGKPSFDCSRVFERWRDGKEDCIEPPRLDEFW